MSERSLCLQAAINGNQVTIPTVTVENELPADSDFKLDLYDYVLNSFTVRSGAETVVKGTDSYTLTDSDFMKFHLMTNTTGGIHIMTVISNFIWTVMLSRYVRNDKQHRT